MNILQFKLILKIFSLYSLKELIKILRHYFINSSFQSSFQHEYFLIKSLSKKNIKINQRNGFLTFKKKVNNKNSSFIIQKNSSDSQVFNQIILKKEYAELLKIISKHKIPLTNMIDAGSNIGLSSIFFKANFPRIKIIALEPNKLNFYKMNKNFLSNNYGDIKVLNKALFGEKTFLKEDYTFKDGKDWSFRLVKTSNQNEANYEAIDVTVLMNDFKLNLIDFIKIDIEGGEFSVFDKGANLNWLEKTRLITIEIHEDCGSKQDIEKLLFENNFELYSSGELTIGLNKTLLKK